MAFRCLCSLLLLSTFACAQDMTYRNVWHFYDYLGLDFSTTPPTTLSGAAGGQINFTDPISNTAAAGEGCASFSDSITGALLFYTDGITVWNRNHAVMANGNGLLGNASSYQSCVIVPDPNNNAEYYIITLDEVETTNDPPNEGLRYTKVDMNANGGLGEVIAAEKNVLLLAGAQCSEKFAVARHCNRRDFWIVIQTRASNAYNAYLLDLAGISAAPVISNVGDAPANTTVSLNTPYEDDGYANMKFSSNSRVLVNPFWVTGTTQVFDFDNSNGQLTGRAALINPPAGAAGPSGTAFSLSGNFLYITYDGGPFNGPGTDSRIYQFDLAAGNEAAINASAFQVDQQANKWIYNAMTLGPDGNIYVATQGRSSLGVVSNVETGGGATYNHAGITFASGQCGYAMTAFIPPPLPPERHYDSLLVLCTEDPAMDLNTYLDFAINKTGVWEDFSAVNATTPGTFDEASGVLNTTSLTPGTRYKFLFTETCGETDTILLEIQTPLDTEPIADSIVCDGAVPVTFTAVGSGGTVEYNWENQGFSATATYDAMGEGNFSVEIRNECDTVTETVQLSFSPNLQINPMLDPTICPGETTVLTPDVTNENETGTARYEWSDGSANNTLNASTNGWFWVDIIVDCDTVRDSVFVTVQPELVTEPLTDSTVCNGAVPVTFTATGSGGNVEYNWENQGFSATATYDAMAAGTYSVQIRNECDTVTETVQLFLSPDLQVNPMTDLTICPDGTAILTPDVINENETGPARFEWSDGSTNNALAASTDGWFWVDIIVVCDTVRDSVRLNVEPELIVDPIPDTTICEGGVATLVANATQYSGNVYYSWLDGPATATHNVTQEATYVVSISDDCNAQENIEVQVNVIESFDPPVFSDTLMCPDFASPIEFDATVAGRDDIDYLWNGNTTDPVFLAQDSGSFSVQLSDTYNCQSELVTVNVTYSPPLDIDLGPDVDLCGSDSAVWDFSGKTGVQLFRWNNGEWTSLDTYTTHVSETVTLEITDSYCFASDTANVLRHPQLEAQITGAEICSDSAALLQPVVNITTTTYLWSNLATSPSILTNVPGRHTVIVQDTVCQDTAILHANVIVNDCDFFLWVPNTFTPNGDGSNDLFGASSPSELTSFQLYIFDRWGELIYEADNVNNHWNGYHGRTNIECQIDTYPWKIIYEYRDYRAGGQLKRNVQYGHVNLLR